MITRSNHSNIYPSTCPALVGDVGIGRGVDIRLGNCSMISAKVGRLSGFELQHFEINDIHAEGMGELVVVAAAPERLETSNGGL